MFNFTDPLSQDLINKLKCNKVPDYKVRNALSEQENKLVRLAQHQLNLVEQERQAAKQRQLQIIMRRRKEQRQQELERQRKQQLNKPHNHIKEDDGPEL